MKSDPAKGYLGACEHYNVDPEVDLVAELRRCNTREAGGGSRRSSVSGSTVVSSASLASYASKATTTDRSAYRCLLPNCAHPLHDKAVEALQVGLASSSASHLALLEVDLQGNALTWRGAQSIAKLATQHNEDLATLKLGENTVEDMGCKVLCTALEGSAISVLDLRSNRLTGLSGLSLGDLLGSTRLTSLSLQKNSIDDSGCSYLAKGLGQSSTLIHLSLRFNQITDSGVAYLVDAMEKGEGTHAVLQSLDLGGNKIGDEGAALLTKFVCSGTGASSWGNRPAKRLSSLTKLNLRSNLITDVGAVSLTKTFTPTDGPTPLEELFIGFNTISAVATSNMIASACNSPTLRRLDVQGAQISAHLAASFIPILGGNCLSHIFFNADFEGCEGSPLETLWRLAERAANHPEVQEVALGGAVDDVTECVPAGSVGGFFGERVGVVLLLQLVRSVLSYNRSKRPARGRAGVIHLFAEAESSTPISVEELERIINIISQSASRADDSEASTTGTPLLEALPQPRERVSERGISPVRSVVEPRKGEEKSDVSVSVSASASPNRSVRVEVRGEGVEVHPGSRSGTAVSCGTLSFSSAATAWSLSQGVEMELGGVLDTTVPVEAEPSVAPSTPPVEVKVATPSPFADCVVEVEEEEVEIAVAHHPPLHEDVEDVVVMTFDDIITPHPTDVHSGGDMTDMSGGALVGQGLASLGLLGEGRGLAVGSVQYSHRREETSMKSVMEDLVEAAGGQTGQMQQHPPDLSTPNTRREVVGTPSTVGAPLPGGELPDKFPRVHFAPERGGGEPAKSVRATAGLTAKEALGESPTPTAMMELMARQQVCRLEEMLKPQMSDMADIVEGLQEQITRLAESQNKTDGRIGDVVGVLGHSLDVKTGEAMQRRIEELAAAQGALNDTVTQSIPMIADAQNAANVESKEHFDAVRSLHTRVSTVEQSLQDIAKGVSTRLSQHEEETAQLRADQQTIGHTAAQAVRNVQGAVDALGERTQRCEGEMGGFEGRVGGVEREAAGIMQAHSAMRVKLDSVHGKVEEQQETLSGMAEHMSTVDQQLQLLVDRCDSVEADGKKRDTTKQSIHSTLADLRSRMHTVEEGSVRQANLIESGWQQPLEELRQRTATSLANSKKALQSNEKLAQDVKVVTADWCDGLSTLKPKIEELYSASNGLQGLTGRVRKVEEEVQTSRSDVHAMRERVQEDVQAVMARTLAALPQPAAAPTPITSPAPSQVYSDQVQTIISQQQAILERLEMLSGQVTSHRQAIQSLEQNQSQQQQHPTHQAQPHPTHEPNQVNALLAQLSGAPMNASALSGGTANSVGLYTASEQETHSREREELARELTMLRQETQEAHSLTSELRKRLSERPLATGVSGDTMKQLASRIDLLEEVLKRDQKASLIALEAILAERGDTLQAPQQPQAAASYGRPDRERTITDRVPPLGLNGIGAVTPPAKHTTAATPSWSLSHSSPQAMNVQHRGGGGGGGGQQQQVLVGRRSPLREMPSAPNSQQSTPRFNRHDPRQMVEGVY